MKKHSILPISKTISPKRQAARRHYGVHPYFTRRAWNVVQEYIKNFTTSGEIVLDPFGGSGITPIEALVLGRKAIQVDICPLANVKAGSLVKVTSHFMAGRYCLRRRLHLRTNCLGVEVARVKPAAGGGIEGGGHFPRKYALFSHGVRVRR